MKILHAVFVVAFILAAAMPAHAGRMTKSKQPLAADPDKATIVFMRPGKLLGRAIAVPVYEVTGEELKFVGLVEAGAKVAYPVSAGEHVFMTTIVGGDTGVRFYRANVEAGKSYYFRSHIIDGLWGLQPVHIGELDGDEFKGWDKGTELTENSPRTLEWSKENLPDAERKSGFEPKEVLEEFTLNPEDGR